MGFCELKIAEAVILIPTFFFEKRPGVSFRVLLSNSGYCNSPDRVTVEMLTIALQKHPESIESWLTWSDNKRSDSGWFFRGNSFGGFEVGYFPPHEDRPITEYADILLACANFIKLEIVDTCMMIELENRK